jgi:hypothetical protein
VHPQAGATVKKPRALMTRVQMCGACLTAQRTAEFEAVSAALRVSAPIVSAPNLTAIPQGFKVTMGRAKVAVGAHKPRMANRGDAPTTSHAAYYTGRVCGNSQHTTIRNLAAKGY